MQLIRIVIADDHGLFREGVINLLKDSSELYIVGEASNGRELVNKYFEIKPDVVISDILMPDLSGIEAAKRIIEKDESAKILFLSMYDSEEYVYQILKVGGLGLLNKSVEKPELIKAIKEVNRGIKYFGKDRSEEKLNEIIDKYSNSKESISLQIEELTEREIEILHLVYEGLSSAEIADKLSLSKRTVDSHRSSLMKKLNSNTISQLIKTAIINRII